MKIQAVIPRAVTLGELNRAAFGRARADVPNYLRVIVDSLCQYETVAGIVPAEDASYPRDVKGLPEEDRPVQWGADGPIFIPSVGTAELPTGEYRISSMSGVTVVTVDYDTRTTVLTFDGARGSFRDCHWPEVWAQMGVVDPARIETLETSAPSWGPLDTLHDVVVRSVAHHDLDVDVSDVVSGLTTADRSTLLAEGTIGAAEIVAAATANPAPIVPVAAGGRW